MKGGAPGENLYNFYAFLRNVPQNFKNWQEKAGPCPFPWTPPSGSALELYLNDLHENFMRDDCDPTKACDQVIRCLLYADDLVILSQSGPFLQNSLDNLTT